MTALLTDNLPLLAGAPNGIKKLRELILELAVRGKLVPQDPSDEPASALLKRIAEEKARLVAEGKIKKQKPLAEIDEEEKPYSVPTDWEWVRVAAVGHDWGQKTPDKAFTYIDVGAVDNAAGRISTPQVLMAENAPSRARKVVMPGTVIYSTIRPYLLNVAVIDEAYEQEPIASTAFAIIHPYLEMPARYFLCYLRSPVFVRYVESVQMGIAYPAINDGQFFSGLIPLPPLAEQHRIVAKVDELMALCDRLEAQQADAESAHAQLVQALLNSLTQASDATDFAANWQRLAKYFHILFTTEPSIDALKQALLQLAVMGKLVQQDPNDEPAAELLKHVAEEKVRLFVEGKIKKQKAKVEVAEEEKPFELPDTWEWVRLGEILSLTSGKGFKAEEYALHGARLFQIANVSLGYTKWEIENFLPENYLNEYPELVLKDGDVLIALNRPLLNGKMKVCIISEEDLPAILYQRVGRFSFYDSSVWPKYFYYYLQSHLFIGKLNESLQGSDQPFINQSQVVEFLFSLPPIAEQHRIVAKVDQLMALCDQLKTRLTQARQLNEQLASTLVEQAVA
jgi:type I restriction enzyme S subunit